MSPMKVIPLLSGRRGRGWWVHASRREQPPPTPSLRKEGNRSDFLWALVSHQEGENAFCLLPSAFPHATLANLYLRGHSTRK